MKRHIRLTRDIASMIPQAHPNIPPIKYIMYGVPIGAAEYLNTPVFVDLTKLIAPTGIFVGKIGTGKSTSAKAFLYRQHYIFQTPTIIFDVHGEYSAEVRALGGKVVDMVEHTINPCKRDGNLTISQKALQLTDMLNTIFEFTDIQRAVLIRYIKDGYEKFGESFSFKKLTEAISNDFHKKSADSKTLGALALRFEVLSDDIFGEDDSISLDSLTKSLVCIDVSKIENSYLRNTVMLSVLQHIYNSMLSRQRDEQYQAEGGIRLLIMVDEAGRIASSDHSVATRLVKESRKFKIGLFFGIQDIPDIDSKILSNYGFVFVHKLDNQDYITKIQNDCSFSPDQAARIRMLPVGTAFLKLNFKDASFHSPFLVRVLKEEIPVDYAKQSQKSPQSDGIREIRTPNKVANTTFSEKKENQKFSELELQLLQSVYKNETFVVTEHYKALGINEYQGNKTRQTLEIRGYLESFNLRGNGRRGKILKLTDLAKSELDLGNKTRRNGNEDTKNEIETIRKMIEFAGFSIIKEYSLGGGRQTDLVVDNVIAIEYDTESVREQNIRKNLECGFRKIIQICKSKSQVEPFRKQIDALGLGSKRDKIIIVDFADFLSNGKFAEMIKSAEET